MMAEAAPALVLWIPSSALAALKESASAAYPLECCGLLVGSHETPGSTAAAVGKRVSRIVPTINRAAQPSRAFEVDPAVHIALLRALREPSGQDGEWGEYLLGHYHSHPDAPPVPSARDQAQAWEPDAVWLIAAASVTGADEVRAWQAIRQADGGIGFLPMTMVPI